MLLILIPILEVTSYRYLMLYRYCILQSIYLIFGIMRQQARTWNPFTARKGFRQFLIYALSLLATQLSSAMLQLIAAYLAYATSHVSITYYIRFYIKPICNCVTIQNCMHQVHSSSSCSLVAQLSADDFTAKNSVLTCTLTVTDEYSPKLLFCEVANPHSDVT